MPASASYGESIELTRHNSLEDQRALQVAMELSLLSFGNNMDHHQIDHHSTSPNHHHYNTMDHINSLHYADEMRFLAKKSQNMTECVPVPSSEHVAEIVGRQGNYFSRYFVIVSSVCQLFRNRLSIRAKFFGNGVSELFRPWFFFPPFLCRHNNLSQSFFPFYFFFLYFFRVFSSRPKPLKVINAPPPSFPPVSLSSPPRPQFPFGGVGPHPLPLPSRSKMAAP